MEAPKIAGIAGVIGLSIGILYNFGYFFALDLKLFTLLSYKDHLETLIFFIPLGIIPVLYFIDRRAKANAKSRQTTDATFYIMAVVTLASWLGRDYVAAFPLIMAMIKILVWVASFVLVTYCTAVVVENALMAEGEDEQRIRAMTPAVLGFIVFVTLLGNVTAHEDAGGTRFDTEVTLKAEEQGKPDKRLARVVRAIDGGLLLVFKDAPSQLAYVRYESLTSFAEPLAP